MTLQVPPGFRIRVGCDVTPVSDIADSVERFGDRYLTRVFGAVELADCAGVDRVQGLAARFAAKEAVFKAFAVADLAVAPTEIEVVRVAGLPELRLFGAAAELAAQQGWRQSEVTLSHTDCHAMAVVMVLAESAVPASATRTTSQPTLSG